MTDFENMDVILGDGNLNPIEREVANTTHVSTSRNDTQASFISGGNSSQEIEIRNYIVKNEIPDGIYS